MFTLPFEAYAYASKGRMTNEIIAAKGFTFFRF